MAIRGAGGPPRRILLPALLLAKTRAPVGDRERPHERESQDHRLRAPYGRNAQVRLFQGSLLELFVRRDARSATLQPFEYCLPFDDVEELKDVEAWREFVEDTCGVSLTVYTACLPGAAVSKS